MLDSEITYFGYGSLVNRATRPQHEIATSARLRGWRRSWSHRVLADGNRGACCSLTVMPVTGQANDAVDGVIVSMPRAELAQLDAREAGYDRQVLSADQFDLASAHNGREIIVYVSQPANRFPACDKFPVLQSYIDCVMAGYFERFGEQGLADFLLTTEGWERPVENDRNAPRYPRAVELPAHLLCRFDDMLQQQRLRNQALV